MPFNHTIRPPPFFTVKCPYLHRQGYLRICVWDATLDWPLPFSTQTPQIEGNPSNSPGNREEYDLPVREMIPASTTLRPTQTPPQFTQKEIIRNILRIWEFWLVCPAAHDYRVVLMCRFLWFYRLPLLREQIEIPLRSHRWGKH